MAATITIAHSDLEIQKPAANGVNSIIGQLNLGTYATNGVAINPDNLQDGSEILDVVCGISVDGTTAYSYNAATGKVRAFTVSGDPGALAEVSNSTDLSGSGKSVACIIMLKEGTRDNVPSTNPVTL